MVCNPFTSNNVQTNVVHCKYIPVYINSIVYKFSYRADAFFDSFQSTGESCIIVKLIIGQQCESSPRETAHNHCVLARPLWPGGSAYNQIRQQCADRGPTGSLSVGSAAVAEPSVSTLQQLPPHFTFIYLHCSGSRSVFNQSVWIGMEMCMVVPIQLIDVQFITAESKH